MNPSNENLLFPFFVRVKIVRLLFLHWKYVIIVDEIHCHRITVYRIQF